MDRKNIYSEHISVFQGNGLLKPTSLRFINGLYNYLDEMLTDFRIRNSITVVSFTVRVKNFNDLNGLFNNQSFSKLDSYSSYMCFIRYIY